MTKKSELKKEKNPLLPDPSFTGFVIVSEKKNPRAKVAKGFVKPNVNLKQGHLRKKKGN